MSGIKKTSIKLKLMLINFMTVAILLVLVCGGLILNEYFSFKKTLIDTLTIQGRMIGHNITATLSFNDPIVGEEILSTIGFAPNIVGASIYKDGRPFARYQAKKESPLPDPSILKDGYRFGFSFLDVIQSIRLNGETIGVIYIRSDLKEMYSHFFLYVGTVLGILAVSLCIAFLLLSRFQKTFTNPIFALAELMQKVSQNKDYSTRTNIRTGDEFDTLAEGFNGMLEQIQNRDIVLATTNEELRGRKEELAKIFEEGPLGMAIISIDYHFIRVNAMLARITGHTEEDLIQLSLTDIFNSEEVNDFIQYSQKMSNGEISSYNMEAQFIKKDGTSIWGNLTTSMIREKSGKPLYFIGMLKDITEQRKLYEKLKHDAMHDGLTNLANKTLFIERLQGLISRTKRNSDYKFAVLFLDLDRFKNVNDSLGHIMGDELLKKVAERLKNSVRVYNTISRLGGDEFAILLEGFLDDIVPLNIANRIKSELAPPFRFNEQEVFVTVSIGVVLSSLGYQKAEDVIRDADIAMYQAKNHDRNCHVVFNETMHSEVKRYIKIENDLRYAINRNELLVYYQPIVSLNTGNLVGFEALVRWKIPSGEIVPPVKFIPVAEETGLIVPIGKWVFQEACRQVSVWQKEFPSNPPLTVSINLSSKQIKVDLIKDIKEILNEIDINPETLRVEITESILMNNPEVSSKFLLELKKMNIRVCFDDFGTGYSSLSYLHKFHMDALKIDRSFISTMSINENAMAIVKSVIAMAHSLKKYVIAEGVETIEQLEELKKLNCEYYQGYLYSKPLDSKEVEDFLRQKKYLKSAI